MERYTIGDQTFEIGSIVILPLPKGGFRRGRIVSFHKRHPLLNEEANRIRTCMVEFDDGAVRSCDLDKINLDRTRMWKTAGFTKVFPRGSEVITPSGLKGTTVGVVVKGTHPLWNKRYVVEFNNGDIEVIQAQELNKAQPSS